VFAKTAEHLNVLASEIEKTIATNSADKGTRDESLLELRPAHEEAVAAEIAVAHQPAARPPRMILLLSVAVLGSIVGAFLWANNPVKSKPETAPAPRDETRQAIATLLSGEQAERKILMDQLGALTARLDSLVTALDNLKTSHGEIAAPSTLENPAAAKQIERRGRRYR
jgi:hypothetical protein